MKIATLFISFLVLAVEARKRSVLNSTPSRTNKKSSKSATQPELLTAKLKGLIKDGANISVEKLTLDECKVVCSDTVNCTMLVKNVTPAELTGQATFVKNNLCKGFHLRDTVESLPQGDLKTAWKNVCKFGDTSFRFWMMLWWIPLFAILSVHVVGGEGVVDDIKQQLTQAVIDTLNYYPMAADAASLVTNAIKAQDINGLAFERLISESLNVKHRDEQFKAIRLAGSIKGAVGQEITGLGPELGKSIRSVDEEHIRIIAGDQEAKPTSDSTSASKHAGAPTSNTGQTVITGPQNSLNGTKTTLSFSGLLDLLSGGTPVSTPDPSSGTGISDIKDTCTAGVPSHGVVSTTSTPTKKPRFSSLNDWGAGILLSLGLVGSCAMSKSFSFIINKLDWSSFHPNRTCSKIRNCILIGAELGTMMKLAAVIIVILGGSLAFDQEYLEKAYQVAQEELRQAQDAFDLAQTRMVDTTKTNEELDTQATSLKQLETREEALGESRRAAILALESANKNESESQSEYDRSLNAVPKIADLQAKTAHEKDHINTIKQSMEEAVNAKIVDEAKLVSKKHWAQAEATAIKDSNLRYVLEEELRVMQEVQLELAIDLEKIVDSYLEVMSGLRPAIANLVDLNDFDRHVASLTRSKRDTNILQSVEFLHSIVLKHRKAIESVRFSEYDAMMKKTVFRIETLSELNAVTQKTKKRCNFESSNAVLPNDKGHIDTLLAQINDYIDSLNDLIAHNDEIIVNECKLSQSLSRQQGLERELTMAIDEESANNPDVSEPFQKLQKASEERHALYSQFLEGERKLVKLQAQMNRIGSKVKQLKEEKTQAKFFRKTLVSNVERKKHIVQKLLERINVMKRRHSKSALVVLETALPKVLQDDQEGWSAWDELAHIYLPPEELRVQLDHLIERYPLLKKEASAIDMVNRAISVVRVEIDILKCTRRLDYFVNNLKHEFKQGNFHKISNEKPFFIHDWVMELTKLNDPAANSPLIILGLVKNFLKSKALSRKILQYSLAILAAVPGDAMESVAVKDTIRAILLDSVRLRNPAESNPEEAEEYKRLSQNVARTYSRHVGEWRAEVFREGVPSMEPSKISQLVEEANRATPSLPTSDYLNVPVNYLMNQAYVKNMNKSHKKQVLTLLAAIIVRQHDEGDLPTPSLVRYYMETKRVVPEADGVDDGPLIPLSVAKDLKAAADQIAADNVNRQQQLWSLEVGEAREIKRIIRIPPEGRPVDKIHRIAEMAYNNNAVEAIHHPQRHHDPKYWLNKYYMCMDKQLASCPAYFCAAGMTESPLQDIAMVHCYDFVKGLKGKMPTQLPDEGEAKFFLYRSLRIEMVKMSDTDRFMKKFISSAISIYGRSKHLNPM
ncbi:hypothetical protein PSACC_02478 [Paramicrosporidium saccamoebae]|uniref:Uncharacterized protein n=1 Tax=Paramicrosporidium saccamoebae TaxID=1246581 RepID=A0A2H9TJ01_9FUNG|nr:hypothetical protein PSACC_02478 [Paramicrosporidium saccamoebae]